MNFYPSFRPALTFLALATVPFTLTAGCIDGELSCEERGLGGNCGESGGSAGFGATGGDAGASASGGSAATGGTGATGGNPPAGGAGGATGGSAGTGGDAGSAGSAGAPGCDCSGNSPVCIEDTGDCVQCTDNTHCSDATPVCNTDSNSCVACTENTHCSGDTPFCDTDSNSCVTCLANDACTDPTASLCEDGQCAPCLNNDDCAHIEGKAVCDAGECVECTGTDYAACGIDAKTSTPYVCDTLNRTCTSLLEHDVGACESCVSDAHCQLGHLCALQTFGDTPDEVGYFCHWKRGDTDNGAPALCSSAPPYVKTISAASSIDGATADLCGLAVSTCTARNEFRAKDCTVAMSPDDTLCGFDPPNDARCVEFDTGVYRCTMRCGSDDDCPPSFSCNTAPLQPYCEL